MTKELTIQARNNDIGKAIDFIQSALKESDVERSKAYRSTLVIEELLALMIQHAPGEEASVRIRVHNKKKYAGITITARGSEFSLSNTESAGLAMDFEAFNDEQESAIRAMLLNAYSDSAQLRHVRGMNRAEVYAGEKTGRQHSFTLLCMVLGLALGAAMRLLPATVSGFISTNIFSVISKMFLNAINMLVVPMVFFAVAASVTGYTDLKAFGRIGGKVLRLYLFTSLMAFFIAVAVMKVFHPGDPSLQNAVLTLAETSRIQAADPMTLPKVLIGLVPSNFVGAFVNGDMLQIIFLSLITGLVSGKLGEYTEGFQRFLRAGNTFFTQITKIFFSVTPAAVFCIMANMTLKVDADSLNALIMLFVCTAAGILVLFGFYALLLAVLGRKSPMQFLKKFRHALLMGMSTTSSSASLPAVMECVRDMGVSPKLYSFSLPLGNIVNMDGMTIFFTVSVMFMMRVFGVHMNAAMFIALMLNVLLIAAATPGIPNASIVMLALLFTQFGIPAGAVAFVIGYDTLIRILRAPSNITGDAVVTLIVAANEGMLDEEKFNS